MWVTGVTGAYKNYRRMGCLYTALALLAISSLNQDGASTSRCFLEILISPLTSTSNVASCLMGDTGSLKN